MRLLPSSGGPARRRPAWPVVVAFVVALCATASAPGWRSLAGAAGAGATAVRVQPGPVAPGGTITVTASGLPPSADYLVQVCGDGGEGSSATCETTGATTGAASARGDFVVRLPVALPPAPCPCVVEVRPVHGTGAAVEPVVTAPVTILGSAERAPVQTLGVESPSGLRVTRAALVGSASVAEWFGGSPRRTLVLTLTDAGPDPVPSTPFVLRTGQGPDPTGIVAAPAVPPLSPGQTVRYRVPVTFPAFAAGTYEVRGDLGSPGQTVVFTATTGLFPWAAALVVGLFLLAAIILAVRSRRRRRPGRRPPTVVDVPVRERVLSGHAGLLAVVVGVALATSACSASSPAAARRHPASTTTTIGGTLADRYRAVILQGDHQLQALSAKLAGAAGNLAAIDAGFQAIGTTYAHAAAEIRALPFPSSMRGDVVALTKAMDTLAGDGAAGAHLTSSTDLSALFTTLHTDQQAEVTADNAVNHDLGITSIG